MYIYERMTICLYMNDYMNEYISIYILGYIYMNEYIYVYISYKIHPAMRKRAQLKPVKKTTIV